MPRRLIVALSLLLLVAFLVPASVHAGVFFKFRNGMTQYTPGAIVTTYQTGANKPVDNPASAATMVNPSASAANQANRLGSAVNSPADAALATVKGTTVYRSTSSVQGVAATTRVVKYVVRPAQGTPAGTSRSSSPATTIRVTTGTKVVRATPKTTPAASQSGSAPAQSGTQPSAQLVTPAVPTAQPGTPAAPAAQPGTPAVPAPASPPQASQPAAPAQPAPSQQPTSPAQPSQAASVPSKTASPAGTGFALTPQEQQMVDLVNQERIKAGLQPLTVDPRLTELARLKAQDMVKNNYFDHISPTYGSPFDMMRQAGITYRTAGENIAAASSVERAHTALMNSSGHRANILNPNFTRIGIGIVPDPTYGLMISQMFIGN